MANKALQQLTYNYAAGMITRFEYRQRRQVLIDKVTGYATGHAQQQIRVPETLSSAPPVMNRYKLILLAIIALATIAAII